MTKTKFLLTTIAVLLCSVMANAYDFEVDGIRYDITSFTELTVKASSLSETFVGDLVIPSKVQFNGKELVITEVGDDFAISNTAITALTIQDSVKSVGARAFKNCSHIATIKISPTITLIGQECFSGCTNLKIFTHQGKITIGAKTFCDCRSLEQVVIENLDSLSEGTFKNCVKLSDCYVPNIVSIGKESFLNCASLINFNIPSSVRTIGDSAFEFCSNIISIIVPNNVNTLGLGAFNYCTSLVSISIGSGLTYLPWVFQGCTNLSDIRIEDATTTLRFGYTGERSFSSNYSEGYIRERRYNYFYSSAMFAGYNIKQLYIGRNITTESYLFKRYYQSGAYSLEDSYYVPNPPFSGSNIEKLTIGPLVSDLKMCPLYKTSIPEIYASSWNGAFGGCVNLDSITLYSIATSIPENTFSGCSKISTLEIPNIVKEIGANAFANCSELKTLSLGSSLVSIGDNALVGCESLNEIYIKSPNPPTYPTGFSSANYINMNVYVPKGYLSIYQESEPWKNFWNLSESNNLFFEKEGLKYALINNNNVEIVGHNISEPTDLYIKSQIEYSGNNYNVVAISHYAFKECSYLSSVQIENGIKDIGNSAFFNCYELKKLIIPSSVTNVGLDALNGCRKLRELILEDGDAPLLLSHKGEYESGSGYIDANGKKIYIEYYNSYFSNIPIEVLYIGRNLSNESRYVISSKNWNEGGRFYYNTIYSYDAAFYNLPKLKKIIIGENVECLGPEEEYISEFDLYVTPGSFKKCSSIQTVEVKNPTPPTGAEFSDAVYSKAHLTVPVESKSLYKEAIGWKDFVSLMKYKITYVVDDSIYFADTLLVGDTIILPATPIKEGYSFNGWSEIPATMPAEDIIVTGRFTINSYKITYIVDGEIYSTDSVAYGTKIIAIEEPNKEGHTFNGWSEIPETMPAEDIIIVGAFKYAVTYLVNNEVYNTDSIVYGDNIVFIEEPIQEGYTFSGWSDIPETMPAEDITITGSFTPNTYTITYMVDEEIYAVDTIAYGDTIALIAEPTQEGYTFSGWSEVPETMPAEEIVVTGSFVRNTYTITYVVDSVVYATDSITYGDTIILLEEPTQEGYTFSGWSDAPVTMPAEDIIIEGSFNVNYYALKYIVDNEPFATDSLAYGDTIILREEPQKEDFEFSGWSEAPETMPAHDVEVYGNFIFTSVTDVKVDPEQSQKVVEDNQLFIILPNGRKYNVMGMEL